MAKREIKRLQEILAEIGNHSDVKNCKCGRRVIIQWSWFAAHYFIRCDRCGSNVNSYCAEGVRRHWNKYCAEPADPVIDFQI